MSTGFKKISICNYNQLHCDTLIYDRQTNEIVFFSAIGYKQVMKISLAKLKETKPYAYMRETGTLQMVKDEYIIETKKQADGEYVHATAHLRDKYEETNEGNTGGEKLRAFIYYTDHEDKQRKIYDKIYKHLSVPMLPEWREYICNIITNRNFVSELTVITGHDNLPFRACKLLITKRQLAEIISGGLREGHINVMGSNDPSLLIGSIKGLNDYLNVFGETLAAKIQDSFRPKFIPGVDSYDEFANNYDDSVYSTGIEIFEAQKSVIQATVNNLKKQSSTYVISEMGTGKTLMGAGAAYAHHSFKNKRGLNSIVLCPGHLVEKWKREIENFVPNSKAMIVKHISDITGLESRLRNKKKIENTFVIISKEDAKLTYLERPCAVWSERLNTFVCPDCGKPLHKKIKNEWFKFDETDMLTKLAMNSKCTNKVTKWNRKERKYEEVECNAKLWTVLNKSDETISYRWIKLGAEGWLQRSHLALLKLKYEARQTNSELTPLSKKERELLARINEELEKMEEIDYKNSYAAKRRYSVAKYIKEHMKGVFDYCIGDEIHLYKGNSQQGQALADLIASSKKSILLTGTLLNGYASGLFYLLYRTVPKLMKADGLNYNSEMEFTRRYGVTMSTSRTSGRSRRTSTTEKALPGVSPLVFTKFLLNNAVFLSMSDMSEGLPQYEEIPLGVDMDSDLRNAYGEFERDFSRQAGQYTSGSRKIMGRMVQALTSYADCPHMPDPIINPDTQQIVVDPVALPKQVRNKDLALRDLVLEKIEAGEKVLVYYSWVNKSDIGESLIALLKEHDIDARVMTSKVKLEDRESWVEKNIDDGMQVMICNPTLVETGLDLLDFTTIVFYQMGYNLFTLRQASRRSWRLSQTKERVQVYFMYYKDTIQQRAISLMATKLQASMALEGKFSEEGLRAMSNNEDMLTQIASNVVEGIKDTVDENIFAAAKFMKAERQGPRIHNKNRSVLEIPMDEYGLREFYRLKYVLPKMVAKPQKTTTNLLNNRKELLSILTV